MMVLTTTDTTELMSEEKPDALRILDASSSGHGVAEGVGVGVDVSGAVAMVTVGDGEADGEGQGVGISGGFSVGDGVPGEAGDVGCGGIT